MKTKALTLWTAVGAAILAAALLAPVASPLGSPLSNSFLAARQADATGEVVDPVDNILRFSGTVQIMPIPELGTWAMLLAGFGLLAFLRHGKA